MYLSIYYVYVYYKRNPKNEILMFSHQKSMYIKVIKIIMTAIVNPENGRSHVEPIFLLFLDFPVGIYKKIIKFFLCVWFLFFYLFFFVFLVFFLALFICKFICCLFVPFRNSYNLEIIFTCSDLKLIIVCNLVYIMNISFYDASHLKNC